MKKLFVGKLSLSTTEAGLRTLFAPYEPLSSVKIVTDKFSGDSRGFAFIEVDDNQSADDAVDALNGSVLDGRTIIVSEARPQTERSGGFGDRSDRGNSFGYGNRRDRPSSGSRY